MVQFACDVCGSESVIQSDLGQYICADCGTQSQEMMEEAAEDGMLNKPNAFARTIDSHVERHETQDAEEAVLTAMEASDGAAIGDDPVAATAIAYVTGMQLVLQGVLEALVAKFGCSEEVIGVAGEMWHSLVQQSEVLCDGLEREAAAYVPRKDWPAGEEDVAGLDDIDPTIDEDELADAAAADSGPEPEPEPQPKKRRKRKARKVLKKATKKKPSTGMGPGQQARRIFGVLSRRLPTDLPLSIAYLACFWLRESILPTDIVRWTLEGHIPYLAPSLSLPPHIEQRLRGVAVHPLSIPSPRNIEFRAVVIADRLNLELPPINAHLVAARLLKDLGLPDSLAAPVDRLLDLVTPQGFWISSSKRAIPPRTFVAAIILIAVKLLHHLGGPITSKTKGKQHQLTPNPEVLRNLTPPSRGLQMPSPAPPLITRPGEPVDLHNLDRYLRYLKEVIFKRAEPAADLKEYHTACEKLFQGAVSAAAARPRTPPAKDADVVGPQKADCDVGVLTPMLDTEEPMEHELIHYLGNNVNASGHRDYVRLLRSLAAAIWVTPTGLHKVVKEVELDLIDLERSLQKHLSQSDTWQAGT